MENYRCHITIDNQTPLHLKLTGTDIPWGHFESGPKPDILPEHLDIAFVAAGAKFGLSGTEGTVTYAASNDAQSTLRIRFDVPTTPFSSNTVEAKAGDGLSATVQGFNGSGSTESCVIRITEA